LLATIGLASALPSQNLHPLSDEFIEDINNKQSTWKAGRNFEIEDYELFKVLATGAKRSRVPIVHKKIHNEDDNIPESFDARDAWPECADIISLIRDQSRCGSCWAFAAVESMSDRICIQSNATRKILVSAQDLLTCGDAGGCDGGWPDFAWMAWTSDGIVTGGLYNNTDQGCQSYFLPPCEDHPNKCRDYVNTPDCKTACDVSSLQYQEQKTYGLDYVGLGGEKQIQLELLKNGPVEATMEVWSDFASYKSGIYQQTSGTYEGGHAVKILGWGVENNVKYWLIANSWNQRWGENGYFRIIRGQNEVGIEGDITAGLPDFSKF
jgi:cathepsin B